MSLSPLQTFSQNLIERRRIKVSHLQLRKYNKVKKEDKFIFKSDKNNALFTFFFFLCHTSHVSCVFLECSHVYFSDIPMCISLIQDATAWHGRPKAGRALLGGNIGGEANIVHAAI